MLSSMTARARGSQLSAQSIPTRPLSENLDATFKEQAVCMTVDVEAAGFPTESKFGPIAGRGAIPAKMYKPTHGGYPDASKS